MQPGEPVGIVGPFHPYRGGIAHHTSLLASTLSQDHPVVGFNFTRLYPDILFPGKTQFDESENPERPVEVPVQRVLDSISPLSWIKTSQAIRASGVRWVIFAWWHPFFAPAYYTIARLLRRWDIRVLFLCHNVMPHESSWVDSALIRLGLGSAEGFVLQSETDRTALLGVFKDPKYVVTPLPAFTFFNSGNAVSQQQARSALSVSGHVVLFFGLIRKYKGLDILLRAIKELGDNCPVTLIVAGEFYEDAREYEELVQALGIGTQVRFEAKYIPNEEVETYFQAADLVVLPYRSATQSGIVQVALSFKKPSIVTRVGSLADAVQEGQTGFVVPPENPAALAAAIERFFHDDLIEQMRPHLETAVEAFSWQGMKRAIAELTARIGGASS